MLKDIRDVIQDQTRIYNTSIFGGLILGTVQKRKRIGCPPIYGRGCRAEGT